MNPSLNPQDFKEQFKPEEEKEKRGGAPLLPVANVGAPFYAHPLLLAAGRIFNSKLGFTAIIAGTMISSAAVGLTLRRQMIRQEKLARSHNSLRALFSGPAEAGALIRSSGGRADGLSYVAGSGLEQNGGGAGAGAPGSDKSPSPQASGNTTGGSGMDAQDAQAVAEAIAQAQGTAAAEGAGAKGAGGPAGFGRAQRLDGRGLSELEGRFGGSMRPQGESMGQLREFTDASVKTQSKANAPARGRAVGGVWSIRGRSVNTAAGSHLKQMAPDFAANKAGNATAAQAIQGKHYDSSNPNAPDITGGGTPLGGIGPNAGVASSMPKPIADAGEGGPLYANSTPIQQQPPPITPTGPDLTPFKVMINVGKGLAVLGVLLSILARFNPMAKTAANLVGAALMGIGAALLLNRQGLQGMLFIAAGGAILASNLFAQFKFPDKGKLSALAKIPGLAKLIKYGTIGFALPALSSLAPNAVGNSEFVKGLFPEIGPIDQAIEKKMTEFGEAIESW